jgi:hypothetical protein
MKKLLRFFTAISITLLCLFPVTASAAQAAEPQNAMAVVICESGGTYYASTAFAISGDKSGATTFITNYQIAAIKPDEIYIATEEISADGAVPAKLTSASANLGVAVVTASSPVSGCTPFKLTSSKSLSKGDAVYALGFGSMQTDAPCTVDDVVYQEGEVLGTSNSTDEKVQLFVTSCQMDKQNTGGPLVTKDGTVVGVSLGENEENGIALPVDYLMQSANSGSGSKTASKSSDSSSGFDFRFLIIPAVIGLIIGFFVRRNKTKPTVRQANMNVPQYNQNAQFSGTAPTPPPAYNTEPVKTQQQSYRKLFITGISGYFINNSFTVRDRVLIGRDAQKCNVVFPPASAGISALHCEIINQAGHLELVDRGSTYGTFLGDGTRLDVNRPYTLNVGETFYLGTVDNRFSVGGEQ